MTVADLRSRMTVDEYLGWIRYHSEDREAAGEPQKPKGKVIGSMEDAVKFWGGD